MSGILIKLDLQGDTKIGRAVRKLGRRDKIIIRRALSEGIRDIHTLAFDLLSGSKDPSGQFPVNIVTGHLRRSEYFVLPGRTTRSSGRTFRAGPSEAIAGNAAEYAGVVHEGMFTTRDNKILSFIFGRRPYLEKAVDDFGKEKGLLKLITKHLKKEVRAQRLA